MLHFRVDIYIIQVQSKMNCAWNDSTQCQRIFKAIQYTNSMVNIEFHPDGIRIMSMDGSKTSLIRLQLKKHFFKSYRCENECVFGLHTETLTTVLQKAKGSELIWKADDDTTLNIVLVQNDQMTKFSIRAIDIDEDALDIPELQDDIRLKMKDSVIKDWADKMMMTKADGRFKITRSTFICESSSITIGTVEHSEPIGGERVELQSYTKDVDITLSFHALKSILAFCTCGQNCWMGFSNDMPSRLHVALADDSHLCLYVAPKIQED